MVERPIHNPDSASFQKSEVAEVNHPEEIVNGSKQGETRYVKGIRRDIRVIPEPDDPHGVLSPYEDGEYLGEIPPSYVPGQRADIEVMGETVVVHDPLRNKEERLIRYPATLEEAQQRPEVSEVFDSIRKNGNVFDAKIYAGNKIQVLVAKSAEHIGHMAQDVKSTIEKHKPEIAAGAAAVGGALIAGVAVEIVHHTKSKQKKK